MTRTMIIVPMKDPEASKTRLSNTLNGSARTGLVRLLYRRTLEFLGPFADRPDIALAVVTGSQAAADMATQHGVQVIPEPAGATLSGALELAAAQAEKWGFDRICIIPADLAAPSTKDLDRILDMDGDVVVCPAQDRGTNALLISPPTAICLHYGPQSAVHHIKAAEHAGLRSQVLPCESFRFDIDTGTCLNRAMTTDPELAQACS